MKTKMIDLKTFACDLLYLLKLVALRIGEMVKEMILEKIQTIRGRLDET